MDLKLGSLELMGSDVPCDSPRVCFPTAASSLPLLAKCLPPMALGCHCPFTFSGAAEGKNVPVHSDSWGRQCPRRGS